MSEDYVCNNKEFIELTGTYQRPIPEPEEVRKEMIVHQGHDHGFITELPREWIGRKVEVRLKGEE